MFKITAQPVNFIFLEFIKATLFKFCYTIFLSSYFLEINTRSKYLLSVLLFLKNHTNTQYKLLIDLAAVDYPQKLHRFELVYNLLSVKMSSRLKVRVKVRSNDVLPTLSFIYKGLNWLEREI
jgi:NADH dehydrogenase (ubiquinone) Fe-S protein 3